jgi:hypothetical protein
VRAAAAAVVAAVAATIGCASPTPSSTDPASCTAAYAKGSACDASPQCGLAVCRCADGTVSDATRGGVCTDAGACDPGPVCERFCGPAHGVTAVNACGP